MTKGDKEVGRVPNALSVNGSDYLRVDLRGQIEIVNRRDDGVEVEVTRSVLGHADGAGQMGKAEMINAYEDASAVMQPPWWGWYGWPGWWGAVNGVGRFTWKTRIEAGETLMLTYSWHYFWR